MNINNFLQKVGLKYLLVNTTNEFLVEYNTLEENSLYKLTGFSGSTAQALVTPETIFLFVDGRYHIQADLEVDNNNVTVIKLNSWKEFWDKLSEVLPSGETLGLFSKKNSLHQINKFAKNYKIKLIDDDPFETSVYPRSLGEGVVVNEHCEFCNDRRGFDTNCNIELNIELSGFTTEQKVARIAHIIDLQENEVLYLTDLDDVSYLFNMRNYSIPYSAKIRGKALVFKEHAKLFTEFDELEKFLAQTKLTVIIDPATINGYDAYLLENSGTKILDVETNPVQVLKSRKTEAELKTMQDAFARTDKAVSAVRDYIYNNDNISEYDIAQKLEREFKNQGAVGLSFKSIVAKDKNSALAHYSKSSQNEVITDGSLVLIDCGAYFEGGLATDITRVFVKGEPKPIHKKIYTTVLRAFLNAFNFRGRTGFEYDNMVREFFAKEDCEGFVFNHGLGHGIGINVHEYPPSLSNGEIAKVPIEDGECFSIEPGLYKEGEFGVRLENSCYFKDGKIHSFVKMNYEDKLIDYNLLTAQEKIWLTDFEVK